MADSDFGGSGKRRHFSDVGNGIGVTIAEPWEEEEEEEEGRGEEAAAVLAEAALVGPVELGRAAAACWT
jgi:hypothetical protein